MAKYIDRDAFLAKERAWYCDNCDRRKNSKGKTVYEIGEAPCRACDIGDVLDLLEDYPAADVIERKTGKWILPNNAVAVSLNEWICSECNYLINGKHRYCPNCGADMRGDDDV